VRIAIYHNLPSGGAKRTLFEFVRRTTRHHTVDVFSLETADHKFADIRPFVNQHVIYPYKPKPLLNSPFGRINQFLRLSDLYSLDSINREIATQIDQQSYDVLFVDPCIYENAPSILKYIQSVPTVYYCHEPPRIIYEVMPKRPYDLQDSIFRSTLNRIDPLRYLYFTKLKNNNHKNIISAKVVLVNSKFTQSFVKKIYHIEPQISYHGVDANTFQPSSTNKDRFILSVGSLTPLKGFDFIIRALGIIHPRYRPNLKLVSNFQNPEELQFIQTLAAEMQIDLELLTNISDNQLSELYNQTSITVYAPIREPFGLVPLESMASGTPVVAVREGGMQETILDGETGFLVERDPVAFADAIQKLLDDPALAKRMGERGRQHVLQNWTWDQATARLEGYLHTAAKMKAANHQQEIQL
jgi:glycosyltransferase involved in cell wall biosynthesis